MVAGIRAYASGDEKMGNAERSDDSSRSNWPFRLVVAAGAGAGLAVAMLVGTLVDLRGFWQGEIAVCVGIVMGIVIGRLAAGLLLGPPSDRAPDPGTQGKP
jgi:hypothetical protein